MRYLTLKEVAPMWQICGIYKIYTPSKDNPNVASAFLEEVEADCYDCRSVIKESKDFNDKDFSMGKFFCRECGKEQVCPTCNGSRKEKLKIFNHEHDWKTISIWDGDGDGICSTEQCIICKFKRDVI